MKSRTRCGVCAGALSLNGPTRKNLLSGQRARIPSTHNNMGYNTAAAASTIRGRCWTEQDLGGVHQCDYAQPSYSFQPGKKNFWKGGAGRVTATGQKKKERKSLVYNFVSDQHTKHPPTSAVQHLSVWQLTPLLFLSTQRVVCLSLGFVLTSSNRRTDGKLNYTNKRIGIGYTQ